MDPNATLAEIRKLVKSINNQHDREEFDYLEDCTRLAGLVEALDNWITNGGFFPDAWSNLTIEQRKILRGIQ